MTISKVCEAVEVICSSEKRKRWTPYEKQQIVQETYVPGVSVSYVARKHGISPSHLFIWRRAMEKGGLTGVKSEEDVVPLSEVNELKKRIKQLEQTLGKKSLENEILREALNMAREKKLISRKPLFGEGNLE